MYLESQYNHVFSDLCLEIATISTVHEIRRPKYKVYQFGGSEMICGLHAYSEMGLGMFSVPKPWGVMSLLHSPGHKRKGSSKYKEEL